jgi:two-component system chemotaxis sensor kinase CheA
MSVPVSLTSFAALMVESSGVVACIPQESVRHTFLVTSQDVTRSGTDEAIAWNGRVIPFVLLQDVVGQRQAADARRSRWSAVVVASGTALAAIGVEGLLGFRTVVTQTLPRMAAVDPVVAGATFDAAGTPLLVLDPAGLVEAATRPRSLEVRTNLVLPPVLVVDDSLTTRMLEQSILESAGHTVELASSAEEALSKAKVRQYSLFLVDVEMPGMNGFEFVARTRADSALCHVPAIMVTSRDSDEDRRRGQEAGADAYIVKSGFDQEVFLRTVRRLVGA